MSSTASAPVAMPARPHTRWGFAVLFGAVGALIVGLVVLAFVWPIATATARDLPIAITGSDTQVSAVEKAVDANAPGVVDFQRVSDRDAAVAKIQDRTVYGAIVLPSAQ
ncbi:MAG: ABC transporter permease, partial [Actinomycetota bacterium]|nr:ABC transporter permease [Actinomycetota bacterium]